MARPNGHIRGAESHSILPAIPGTYRMHTYADSGQWICQHAAGASFRYALKRVCAP